MIGLLNVIFSCIIEASGRCLKYAKTSPIFKNLTDFVVDIENPCGARAGALFFMKNETMYMFENGKNDQKSHFLTKTPFSGLVPQGLQGTESRAQSYRLRY